MIQQINLYQPMFRKQEKVFSALAMGQVLLIMLVVFGAIYAYGLRQVGHLSRQLESTDKTVLQMQQQVARMERANPAPSKLLESEIRSVTAKLERRKAIIDALKQGSFGNLSGFSGFLEALARQHVDGSWLTGIEFKGGGGWVRLNGYSRAAELVPVYLQRLLTEQVFVRTTINDLAIRQAAGDPSRVEFEARSDAGETKRAGS